MVHQQFVDIKKVYELGRKEVSYNILIEFGIPLKIVSLIQICLHETYSRVWVGKHLSDRFPVKNGLKQVDALAPLLFNFEFECAVGGFRQTRRA